METFISILESTLRMATPLVLASQAGFLSERSGVINIALESKMLMGAFVAASIAHTYQSTTMGLLAGISVGVLIGLIYAFFTLYAKAEQIVTGVALNLLVVGLTPFLCNLFFGTSGSTPTLPIEMRLGPGFLFVVWGIVGLLTLWQHYTPSGLWHRVAGEKPLALQTAGVSVRTVRWLSLMSSGAIGGLSGASLSLFLSSNFSREMSAGRGFMALAALILGKWRPLQASMACLLFAFTDSLQIRLQGVEISPGNTVPVQLIQILPYLVTLIVLAGFLGKARAPGALGQH